MTLATHTPAQIRIQILKIERKAEDTDSMTEWRTLRDQADDLRRELYANTPSALRHLGLSAPAYEPVPYSEEDMQRAADEAYG